MTVRPYATGIGRLPGITAKQADAFRAAHITTIDQAWIRVARAKQKLDVLAQYGIDRAAMVELLAAQALREGGEQDASVPSPESQCAARWLPLLAALALTVVPLAFHQPRTTVVATATPLAPFEVVLPGHLTRQRVVEGIPGAFQSPRQVVGRYTKTGVPAGTVLTARDLSDVHLTRETRRALVGRPIVTLSIPAHALAIARPGRHLSIVVRPSARERAEVAVGERAHGAAPRYLDDVIVLDARRHAKKASAVVAVRLVDLSKLEAVSSRSDLLFVQQPSQGVATPPAGPSGSTSAGASK